ncbi:MAG: MBL fold metallo-hydrolase [Planctomycetes bacterium]|nr:MBL fold metallo-hydrolase [Planctomycetota bacterium]
MDPPFTALYDEQCEICQAGVTWIRLLDRRGLVRCVPIDAQRLAGIDPRLTLEACARELHVLGPGGRIWRGGAAVRRLARIFAPTWIFGVLAEIPPLNGISNALYRLIAQNRYQLSKCRGGACRTTLSVSQRRAPGLHVFWTCYTTGLLLRIPLVALAAARHLAASIAAWARTRGRAISLLDGRLRLLFLSGFPSDVGSIVFGEMFWTILYKGLLVDPGGPRMRSSLSRRLARLPASSVRAIVATHSHEEHIGNVAFAARRLGVPVHASATCAAVLRRGPRIPFMRGLLIGRPEPWGNDVRILENEIQADGSTLHVYPSPGHCNDHVVLYDPAERLLISGDAFMGAYFSSPNPDVDSLVWLETLRRLSRLPIEILLTGHGQLYTLRRDIPDVPGVVIRRDPAECVREKLEFMEWLRSQVTEGLAEGLPLRAIEATLFPWSRRWAWENLFLDEAARLLSGGEFSRTELVRTFVRRGGAVDPTVYEARRICGRSKEFLPRTPFPK